MIRCPKTHPYDVTVSQVRDVFTDEHVHAVLLVEQGRLLCVVERGDLHARPDSAPALPLGRLFGRTIDAETDLEFARLRMVAEDRRRLAVVDDQWRLLGLLCLKRTSRGFCSENDVAARTQIVPGRSG
jgi:CBS domain-containing protein